MLIADEACRLMKLPVSLADVIIEGNRGNEYRTMREMDLADGSVVHLILCPHVHLIQKKQCLTPSLLESAITSVEGMPMWRLQRIITKEYLEELKSIIVEQEENEIISSLLMSLLFCIAYRGAREQGYSDDNIFSEVMSESGITELLEEKIEEMIRRKKGIKIISENEKKLLLSYCYLMSGTAIDYKRLEKILRILNCLPESDKKSYIIAIRCLCHGNSGFFDGIEYYNTLEGIREEKLKKMKEVEELGDISSAFFEDRRILTNVLFCEWSLCPYFYAEEFVTDILFPAFISLLHIPEGISIPAEDDDDTASILNFITSSDGPHAYGIALSKGRAQLRCDKLFFLSSHQQLPRCGRESFHVLQLLLEVESEEKVKEMVGKGWIVGIIRRLREKREKEEHVIQGSCSSLKRMFLSSDNKKRGLLKEWKKSEEMRIAMWLVEEEDAFHSLIRVEQHFIDNDERTKFNRSLGLCLDE
jgi:hypothetical protein